MDLAEFYPDPDELIDSELGVLDHLRNSAYIHEWHPQVARAAKATWETRGKRAGLDFNSHFDVRHQAMVRGGRHRRQVSPNIKLTVSARIERNRKVYTNVTYCFGVCRIADRRGNRLTILRKFHFDVTPGNLPNGRRRQAHPRCHLQYCGEMVPYMETLGCRRSQLNQMHPSLSEPRIFFWPMSLALVIDMALHEFPDQPSAKFRADNYWRGLVHQQEDLVLRPFYEKCIDVIHGGGGDLILAEAFYVK